MQPRADLVRTIMAPYLKPIELLSRYRRLDKRLPMFDLKTQKPSDYHRSIAAERWKWIPDFPDLLEAMRLFGECFVETDEAHLRAFAGMMLDGLPSAKTLQSAGYIDTMTLVLSHDEHDDDDSVGISALAVAAAVLEVWRTTTTFAPAPGVMLATVKKKAKEFAAAQVTADRLYDLRCQAEQVLLAFGDIEAEHLSDNDDVPF